MPKVHKNCDYLGARQSAILFIAERGAPGLLFKIFIDLA
jgi:hypothetical protein